MTVELTHEEAEILIAVLTFAEGAALDFNQTLLPAVHALRPWRSALLMAYMRHGSVSDVPAPPQTDEQREDGAELIGQTIPDMAATESRPIWDCRVCGFGVRDGAALEWIRDHGEHYDTQSEKRQNKGTAYCPNCNDETLRRPNRTNTLSVLEQLRDECAMLYDQERQPVDQQRVEALNAVIGSVSVVEGEASGIAGQERVAQGSSSFAGLPEHLQPSNLPPQKRLCKCGQERYRGGCIGRDVLIDYSCRLIHEGIEFGKSIGGPR